MTRNFFLAQRVNLPRPIFLAILVIVVATLDEDDCGTWPDTTVACQRTGHLLVGVDVEELADWPGS